MTTYRVDYHPTNKIAMISLGAGSAPGGYTAIGTFDHNESDDPISPDPDSHVFFHHVRDLLYKHKPDGTANGVFPNNITDMAGVKIQRRAITALSSTPATVSLDLSNGETQQITNTFTPAAGALDTTVYYKSSDPTKATVSPTGLITAVGVGTATITISTNVEGVSDTIAVTVVA